MNFRILFLFSIISLSLGNYFISDSFAVDFTDSTGYSASWAQNYGYQTVLLKCNEFSGDSRDGNWCNEWIAYVLDQGIENFPQSTSKSTSIPNFTLEDGPLYFGELSKFLPEPSFYGDGALVGKPFTVNDLDKMKNIGVTDMVSQRIVIPDEFDKTNFLKLSYIIMEFDNSKISSQFYSKTKDAVYAQNFPTIAEEFELEEKGIINDKRELEKSLEYFVADCIGQRINIHKYNEEAKLTCIKDNYIIAVNVAATISDSKVDDYSQIIINNIDNNSHRDPKISFPNDAQYVALQYSIEKLSDDELLEYFQKSMDDGKIKFPIETIMIEKNSQRLSYIPDMERNSIGLWGEGILTDAQFAKTMISLVEQGYLTIPGIDSSSITVSSQEKEKFFDMPDSNEQKETQTPSPTIQKSSDNSKKSEEMGLNIAGYGIAALVMFGLPAIIIGSIILKSKKRMTGKIFKKILLVYGILILGLIVSGFVFAGISYFS